MGCEAQRFGDVGLHSPTYAVATGRFLSSSWVRSTHHYYHRFPTTGWARLCRLGCEAQCFWGCWASQPNLRGCHGKIIEQLVGAFHAPLLSPFPDDRLGKACKGSFVGWAVKPNVFIGGIFGMLGMLGLTAQPTWLLRFNADRSQSVICFSTNWAISS